MLSNVIKLLYLHDSYVPLLKNLNFPCKTFNLVNISNNIQHLETSPIPNHQKDKDENTLNSYGDIDGHHR